MWLNEKNFSIQRNEEVKKSHLCYVCGKKTMEGELCCTCAQIISTALNALCLDEGVYESDLVLNF